MSATHQRRVADGQNEARTLAEIFATWRRGVLEPLRAVLRQVQVRGGDPEATLRRLAEERGLDPEEGVEVWRLAQRLRAAAESLDVSDPAVLAEFDQMAAEREEPAAASGEESAALLRELTDLIDVLDDLETARASAPPDLDPAAERELDSIVAALGCSREEARRLVPGAPAREED
jgi:hypothetical protein